MPTYTDDGVRFALRAAAEDVGEPLTQAAYRAWSEGQPQPVPTPPTVADRWGTWKDGCAAADVEPGTPGTYTDEELLDALQRVAEQSDGPLTRATYLQYAGEDDPHADTVTARLGGGNWAAACDAVGVVAATDRGGARMPDWTPATVLAAVGGWLAAQDDSRPSWSTYVAAMRAGDCRPSQRTMKRHVGDWQDVLDLLTEE
jgi:hypothetical protein